MKDSGNLIGSVGFKSTPVLTTAQAWPSAVPRGKNPDHRPVHPAPAQTDEQRKHHEDFLNHGAARRAAERAATPSVNAPGPAISAPSLESLRDEIAQLSALVRAQNATIKGIEARVDALDGGGNFPEAA